MKQFIVNEILLGQDNQTFTDTEQATDIEVFARLRHDAFVRGNDQRDRIDAVRARQHVLHKALVAGHINEANANLAKVEFSESNVDRDAAALLFRQTISVDAGQGAHERSLAVIDVTCRPDDD